MRSIAGALILLVLVALAGPDRSAAQPAADVYTVSGIEVDASAGDAVGAREQALLQGQRDGLERLLERLVPASEYGRLPSPASLSIEPFVQNFGIDEEQVSGTRYLAEMTVAYDPEAIRDLLEAERLPFSQTVSAPVVVLPVYLGGGAAVLWPPEPEPLAGEPDPQPWWTAWSEELDSERLLRLVLPLGDLEDMAKVSAEQALAGDQPALLDLARRYGSTDVLVVTASPTGGEPPSVRLDASLYGEIERQGEAILLPGRAGQSEAELLRDAVPRLQDSLDEEWKRDHLLRLDQVGTIMVEAAYGSLAEWVAIEERLNALEEVSEIEVTSFTRDDATLRLEHLGEREALQAAFERLGWRLVPGEGTWQLQPGRLGPVTNDSPSATPAPFFTAPPPNSPTPSPSSGSSPSSRSSG
jgi:hypothetical protein